MKKRILITLLIFISVAISMFAGDNLPEEFTELLKRTNLTYEIPEDFVEVEPVENSHMLYEYAIKHPIEKFEVRYAIRPIDEMLVEYNEWSKNPKEGETRLDPKNLYPAIGQAVKLNISDKEINGGSLPEESLKNDFGADAGMSYFVMPREAFSNGYKHTMMIAINKKEKGTAFIFYMFDDPKIFAQLAMPIFYNLRFE